MSDEPKHCHPLSTCAHAHAGVLRSAGRWYAQVPGIAKEALGELANGLLKTLAFLVVLPFGWVFGLWWRHTDRQEVETRGACEYHREPAKERT